MDAAQAAVVKAGIAMVTMLLDGVVCLRGRSIRCRLRLCDVVAEFLKVSCGHQRLRGRLNEGDTPPHQLITRHHGQFALSGHGANDLRKAYNRYGTSLSRSRLTDLF